MVLWLVGLGLGDEKDITVKGLEAVKGSAAIYLEAYTSLLGVDKEKLEAFYGKPITVADREFVENECYQMLDKAKQEDVSFLVVGDPFGATTHSDLVLRAKEKGIAVKVWNKFCDYLSAQVLDVVIVTKTKTKRSCIMLPS